MWDRLFGKKKRRPETVVVRLNARLQPLHRGEAFEDPLDATLKAEGLGEVTGGGTMQAASGEIEHCDVELTMSDASDAANARVVAALEALGAPKGSQLELLDAGTERAFGRTEGLAVYLNGTDLPADTYASCDSNVVYAELARLIEGTGRVLSYWQGPTETGFYLYGGSFEDLKRRIEPFLATYPLCAQCRVVRIA